MRHWGMRIIDVKKIISLSIHLFLLNISISGQLVAITQTWYQGFAYGTYIFDYAGVISIQMGYRRVHELVAFCCVVCAGYTGLYDFICWFSLLFLTLLTLLSYCAHLVGGST